MGRAAGAIIEVIESKTKKKVTVRQSDQLRDGWIEESRYTGGGGMGMRGGPAKGASRGARHFSPRPWVLMFSPVLVICKTQDGDKSNG